MNFKTLAEDELEELRLPRFSLRAAFCRPFLGTGQAVCKSRKSPVRPKLAKRYCDAKGSCGIVTHPSCRRKGVEPAAYIKVLILSGAILHTTFCSMSFPRMQMHCSQAITTSVQFTAS